MATAWVPTTKVEHMLDAWLSQERVVGREECKQRPGCARREERVLDEGA
jgi:hypothetical protein